MRPLLVVMLWMFFGAVAGAQTDIHKDADKIRNSFYNSVNANSSADKDRRFFPDSTRIASEYSDPNTIPYRTNKSFFAHALALPSTLWNALWYPVGETFIWIEQSHIHQKVIGFLFNKDLSAGIFPIGNIGGNMGTAIGVMAFHNNLLGNEKSVSFDFLFGSADDNEGNLSYSDKSLFGSPLNFKFNAKYFNDSDENHFIGGNRSREKNETSYSTEKAQFVINWGYRLSKNLNLQLTGRYENVEIGRGQGTGGDIFPKTIPGFGSTNLGGIGSALTLDFRNGWPRTFDGLLVDLEYRFNSEFSDVRYQFHTYAAEIQQFIPIPFLLKDRRLGARAIFRKVEQISGKRIPFYALSTIGDAETLRGFDEDRFRDEGLLLFNLEYRYPIWDTWDAVFFLDGGQVFNEFDQIGMDEFHIGGGFGLRFMTRTGFLFRTEIGFSKEMTRVLLELSPNF